MNISNQVAVAIATFLQGQTVANSPTIVAGITTDLNDEAVSRVIVIGSESSLRKASLPGLYDVTGTINVIQSVDDADGTQMFHDTCASIESLMGGKYGMPAIIKEIDSGLHVYSYQWLGSILAAGARKFMATYQWTVFARNSTTTQPI